MPPLALAGGGAGPPCSVCAVWTRCGASQLGGACEFPKLLPKSYFRRFLRGGVEIRDQKSECDLFDFARVIS
eukprot:4260524-Prymnesium_polylepis.3